MRLAGTPPIIGVVATLLTLPALVQAGPVAKKHDGFFLRLSAGAGFASSSIDLDLGQNPPGPGDTELYDLAGDSNFAIGGIVGKNLALHGTFWGWLVNDPDVEVNGDDVGELNGDLTMSAFGAGVTYYFMPSNLYLTGSFGIGHLGFESDSALVPDGDTEWGPVLDMGLGKEWWVSRNWGLGLAGALGFHSFDDPDFSENWSGVSFAVRFSATFN